MLSFKYRILASLAVFAIFCSCDSASHQQPTKQEATTAEKPATPASAATTPFSKEKILAQPQIPILCYHRLRAWKPTDTRSMKDYIVPVETFRAQMKILADSGYHTILPDQLYAYLTTGASLPSKPVMLTFDDSEEEHFSIAATEMKKYGFKAVFFVMTVTLDRPGYLTKQEIRSLSDEGHVVESHTWDHHNVKKYEGKDWEIQVERPIKTLESITGKPVKYFAYPFGLWNEEAIPQLKKYGIVAAFQLVEKRSQQEPLYTIRRMIVPGEWSAEQMLKRMKSNFPR
jgi:peptidoglycan/xylan/chitin deacetylase (PgdA/CDA1 family)